MNSGMTRRSGNVSVYKERFDPPAWDNQNGSAEGSAQSGSGEGSVKSSGIDARKSESEGSAETFDGCFANPTSTDTRSTTSWFEHENKPPMHHQLAEKISVNVGESVRVFLYAKPVESGIIHMFALGSAPNRAKLATYLLNSTDVPLEPGRLSHHRERSKLPPSCIENYLKVGQLSCRAYAKSGCWTNRFVSLRIGKVISCVVASEKIVLRLTKRRTTTYNLHNKEERQIELLIDHNCSNRSLGTADVNATLHADNKTETIEPPPHQPSFPWVHYWLKLRAGQRCSLIVVEGLEKEQNFHLFDSLSCKLIAKLEAYKAINGDVANRLKEVMRMIREEEKLRRECKLLGKRLEALKKKQRSHAQDGPDCHWRDERLDQGSAEGYMKSMERTEEEMNKIVEMIDKLEYRTIHLRLALDKKRTEICGMKQLN